VISKTILTKSCPDCGGRMELTRGKRSGPKIIRKARIHIEHRLTCPQWLRRVRDHGAYPETTELTHDTPQYVLTERAA
jgi:ssDNA-binding Zn-finger/Zn-ribbon topoisomerase 1